MPRLLLYALALLAPLALYAHQYPAAPVAKQTTDATVPALPAQTEIAVFGSGCFWGVEQTFRQTPGVVATAAGYAGGTVPNPTYALVCTHATGHHEVVRVTFDPTRISYDQLLAVFWKSHDPTAANGLGADGLPRSNSVIFCTTATQETAARASMVERASMSAKPILTTIRPAPIFWRAEEYHQQYHEKMGGVCRK